MLKAIAIISATVVLVMMGFFGAIIIYIFEDEERYEHEEHTKVDTQNGERVLPSDNIQSDSFQ